MQMLDWTKRQLNPVLTTARNDDLRSRWERGAKWPLMALAVATLPLVLAPELLSLSETTRTLFLVFDAIIWSLFAIDLAVRTWLSEHRVRFLLDHPFEVLIVVIPFLRPLRLFRMAPLLRPLAASALLSQILRTRSASWTLVSALIAIAVATVIVAIVERDIEGGIQDWGTVTWWALATITTVGYGDVVPVSTAGRIVGVFLMLVGIGVFGVLTANVAAWFVEQSQDEDQERIRVSLEELEVQSARQEQILDEIGDIKSELRALRDQLGRQNGQD